MVRTYPEKIEPWIDLPLSPRTSIGEFSFELKNLTPNRDYEFRACVRHPLITMYGRGENLPRLSLRAEPGAKGTTSSRTV